MQQIGQAIESRHAANLEPLDQRGLARVSLGDQQVGEPGSPSAQSDGQGTTNRFDLAAERQLAVQRIAFDRFAGNLFGCGQQPDRDREIETGTGLAHVRGREIDRDPLLWKLEARVENGGSHPLTRLADGTVGKADQGEGGKPPANVDLHGDLVAGDAFEGEGGYTREHGRHARPEAVTCG